jgi:nicotinamidase/pyrazinamidase
MSSNETFDLFLIDASVDFSHPDGSLYVPGAYDDAIRTAHLIANLGIAKKQHCCIERIFFAMDAHHPMDITHPIWWFQSGSKKFPPLFTTMVFSDGEVVGVDLEGAHRFYTAAIPELMRAGGPHRGGTVGVMSALQTLGTGITIWPEHNIIGTPGQAVVQPIRTTIRNWEMVTGRHVRWKFKGQSPWTEHHGAFAAQIHLEDDPSTHYDTDLYDEMAFGGRRKLVAGQASTHCVIQTMDQMLDHPDPDPRNPSITPEMIVMLTDTMSPVPGHEERWTAFRDTWEPRGMTFCTTEDIQR